MNNGFSVFKKTDDIIYVIKYSDSNLPSFDPDNIFIAVPDKSTISQEIIDESESIGRFRYNWIAYDNLKKSFVPDIKGTGCMLDVLRISYQGLLTYQRELGLLDYDECQILIEDMPTIFYLQIEKQHTDNQRPCYNKIRSVKSNLHLISVKEQSIIPDIYIQIPIIRTETSKLDSEYNYDTNLFYSNKIIKALEFRTNYEAGDPSAHNTTGFKSRIKRQLLTSVNLQIFTETTLSLNQPSPVEKIGEALEVPLILSSDMLSDCGVLTIPIHSCPLPISQLIDSMSRNQLMVVLDNKPIALLDHIANTFGLYKCGAPKCFITLFDERKNIDDTYISSLLFGETYYEDNTGLGKVVDNKIIHMLGLEYGIAQYNYASVYCYKNAVIQMTSRFRTSINERIIQESITLFYMELIMFEECAISNVENNISNFLNKLDYYNNSTVLSNINSILSNYAKSSDFWDIQMNYPSSRKSVEEIRNAFQISKLREDVSKKKDTLLNICTIRDTILDETEGYFISIIGIIVAAFSCADLINSSHSRQILGFVLLLVCIFIALRLRMNREIRRSRIK